MAAESCCTISEVLWGALGKCNYYTWHHTLSLYKKAPAPAQPCPSHAWRVLHNQLFHHTGYVPSIPFMLWLGTGIISNLTCQTALMRSLSLWLMQNV